MDVYQEHMKEQDKHLDEIKEVNSNKIAEKLHYASQNIEKKIDQTGQYCII